MRLYLIVSVFGAVRAVQRQRPCRFAGLSFPGTPAQQALTVGTPMSAPPVMLVALVIFVRRRKVRWVRMLAAMFLVGSVAEADTPQTLRRPQDDPVSTACTALEIVVPAALLLA
jgi:hypothetical protein